MTFAYYQPQNKIRSAGWYLEEPGKLPVKLGPTSAALAGSLKRLGAKTLRIGQTIATIL